MIRALITTALLVLIFNIGYSQNTRSRCYLNNTDTFTVQIDSGSIWEVGTPTKTFLNGNYSGNQSIVTSLDSNYKNNDTSSFIVDIEIAFENIEVEPLLNFENFQIFFTHRFQLDSSDYGEISVSLNNEEWHPIHENYWNDLSGGFYYNYSVANNDTSFDSLEVTGVSDGWIQSKITPCLNCYWDHTSPFYSIRFKFSLYSDSSASMEGWQIENICLVYYFRPHYWGISELQENSSFQIAPNPANGNFSIKRESSKKERFTIFNNLGQIVKEGELMESEETIPLNLTPGMYFVRVSDGNSLSSQKLIVK